LDPFEGAPGPISAGKCRKTSKLRFTSKFSAKLLPRIVLQGSGAVAIRLPEPGRGPGVRISYGFLQLGEPGPSPCHSTARVWALSGVKNYTKVDPDPSRPAPEALLLVHFRGSSAAGHGVPACSKTHDRNARNKRGSALSLPSRSAPEGRW